jgi:hypothetical protein
LVSTSRGGAASNTVKGVLEAATCSEGSRGVEETGLEITLQNYILFVENSEATDHFTTGNISNEWTDA